MTSAITTIILTPQFAPDWESPPVLTLHHPIYFSRKGESHPKDSLENIILGRGHFTAVLDTHISRRICSVEFLAPEKNLSSLKKRKAADTEELENSNNSQPVPIIRMLKGPNEHKFEINTVKVSVNAGDYVRLNDGDFILLHFAKPYRYRVTFKSSPQAHLNDQCARHPIPSVPSAPLSAPVCHDIVRKAASNLLDDIKCPICMEIFVESHAANCGHIFCVSCVRNWIGDSNPTEHLKQSIECPSCRMMIKNFTLVRQYDSMIWNMLLCRPFSQEDRNNLRDDLMVFLQRCGRDLSTLSSEERECLFGSKELVSNGNLV